MEQTEIKPAEPSIKPETNPERIVKPNENDPWMVPSTYDPKTHPQPTPKGGITYGDRIRFWSNYNSKLIESISIIKNNF